MNVVRFIVEHSYFSGRTNTQLIEELIKPLLQFMVDPKEIEFDDDLVFCVDALIKKSQSVSKTMQDIFPYLENFQSKYKGVLANLTSCLNSYIVYGFEFFSSNPNNILQLQRMA